MPMGLGASEEIGCQESVSQFHRSDWDARLEVAEPAAGKPMTTPRRRKERFSFTSDQGISNQPEFIQQPGIDKAGRNASGPHEIDIFAGLLFEGSDVSESPHETSSLPESRSQSTRDHVVRGLGGEAGPLEFNGRRRFTGHRERIVRPVLYRRGYIPAPSTHASICDVSP